MEKHIKNGNLLTAEQYCNQIGNGNIEGGWENSDQYEQVKKLMIEFAQLHVEAALKAASEQAKLKYQEFGDLELEGIDKKSILNAYPKENIT